MNKFITINWYHYDLNSDIFNYLKTKCKKESTKKNNIIYRLNKDFKLKIH